MGYRRPRAVQDDHNGLLPRRHGHSTRLRRHGRAVIQQCVHESDHQNTSLQVVLLNLQIVVNFTDVRTWHSNIEQHASEGVNKILIGNKCDWVDKKAVTEEQGRELAQELGIKFMETSAKVNEGVEDAFFTLARYTEARSMQCLSITRPISRLSGRAFRDIKTRLIDSQPDTGAGSASAPGQNQQSVNVAKPAGQAANQGCC